MKKHVALFSSALMMSTTLLGAGSVFAESVNPDPNSATTPVNAELTLKDDDTVVNPPVDPGEGGGDQGTEIDGRFGIAYAPSGLSGTGKLEKEGKQKIDLSNNTATKYNVGVKDTTRKNDQNWSLKASLSWTGDDNGYMNGTTIEASNGNVKENKDGHLSELSNSEVETTAESLSIGSSETEIMHSTRGRTMNGIYNYQFENPKLVIPEVSTVTDGTYVGNITWNLSNTPE
ncbi:hypothetical protein DSH85_13640 [Enterococcus faecium]|uniref:WxL domain-containing protein n=1 Tax=Enterococcus faecium TaxID=1352 RepID=UPI0019F866E7|nr:WxL domain-containing protein [Enterococcus faecium]EGP5661845.1 hypothetical protein [Enterococcus faecium]EME7147381.1 WxL domain-containing protein [Enterococcus faecium]MDF3826088.1 WxL domain-containing protein [Enterococcus faecium]